MNPHPFITLTHYTQGPRMDKAFLEDEEIDPTANVRSIKANVMAGGRRGRCVRLCGWG